MTMQKQVSFETMTDSPELYPLHFGPIYQYRLWGGRRLSEFNADPLPGDGPIGEAWILSDRDDFASRVTHGALQNQTIQQLIASAPKQMLGPLADTFSRFPLLLKFLDAREMLSVQVHPSDQHKELLPPGERGKTEAWVVLEADANSKIYAGLNPGTTPEDLRHLTSESADKQLGQFTPKPGDGVFIEAGTVHALGGGVVVFEVQQNSDVTFRLFDWDRVDAQTGQSRELHIEKAISCIDFEKGPLHPVEPNVVALSPAKIETLFDCEFFRLDRLESKDQFSIGREGELRVIVCIEGNGQIYHLTEEYPLRKGDVYILPAQVGKCECQAGGLVHVLEISIPVV